MPSIQHHQQNEPLKLKMRGWTRNHYLYPILTRICEKLGIEISIDGGDIQQTAKGVHLTNTAGVGEEGGNHPFKVTLTGTDILVYPGTFNGVTPTIGGTPIDDLPPPVGTLTGVGTEYVWIHAATTHDATGGYVHGTTLGAVTISGGSTLPTTNFTTNYYVHLATFVDGVKSAQNIISSLSAEWCDDGSATSKAVMTTSQT